MLGFLGSNFGLFPIGGMICLEVFFLGEVLKSKSSQSSHVSDSPAPQRLRPLGCCFFFTDTAKGSWLEESKTFLLLTLPPNLSITMT